jgi:hypothetical protein
MQPVSARPSQFLATAEPGTREPPRINDEKITAPAAQVKHDNVPLGSLNKAVVTLERQLHQYHRIVGCPAFETDQIVVEKDNRLTAGEGNKTGIGRG